MEKQLQVGAAKAKLTPQITVDLGGFAARNEPCSGVLDDIWARSIFLTNGKDKLAIVSVEVVGITPGHVNKLKNQIKQKCGLAEWQILIAATHTHSAPVLDDTLIGCGNVNPEYVKYFNRVVVETCCKSMQNLVPCKMHLAKGNAPDVSYNRRILLKDGTVTPDEGLDESQVARRQAVDDSLQIITMIDSEGRNVAKLVHFACHGVCLGSENTQVSSDLPGWICRHIEDAGESGCCIFLNGATGNINPINKCSGFESLKRNGDLLLAAIKTIESQGMLLMESQTIQTRLTSIQWPFKAEYDIKGFEKLLHDGKADISDPTSVERWTDREALTKWARDSIEKLKKDHLTAFGPIQDVTLGTQRMLGLPFEVFSEVTDLLTNSIGQPISIISFANGVLGYFPAPEEIELGGYEVTISHVFYNQVGCLDAVEALKLIESALKNERK